MSSQTTTSTPEESGACGERAPGGGRRRISRLVVSMAMILLLVAGCSMDMAGDAIESDEMPEEMANFERAERKLEQHRVDDAHDLYETILVDDPSSGQAAAGVAVTELLLMFEYDEVTELLVDHLGAHGGIDANELLYAQEGYLYWASRGVRWNEQSDQYIGIRELLDDELPWDAAHLASIQTFVEGLDAPTGQGFRQLVTVANRLSGIDDHLETALEDDEFARLTIPGEVFHDPALTLRIGPSEVALARAMISLVRSVVYFIAAYEHSWTLERAFSEWDPALDDEHFVEGYTSADYTVAYLDDHLFRSIDSTDRLSASRTGLREALEHARDAIVFGLDHPAATTLEWDNIDEETAYQLDEFLEALIESLDEPTPLPHTEPATTLDLTHLFEEGRVLDEEIDWFVRQHPIGVLGEDDDEPDDSFEAWKLNDEAIHKFFHRDLLDPVPDEGETPVLEIGPGGDPGAIGDELFGAYWQKVEDVYFATR